MRSTCLLFLANRAHKLLHASRSHGIEVRPPCMRTNCMRRYLHEAICVSPIYMRQTVWVSLRWCRLVWNNIDEANLYEAIASRLCRSLHHHCFIWKVYLQLSGLPPWMPHRFLNVFGRKNCQNSFLCSGIPFASPKVMYRPQSHSPLHFNVADNPSHSSISSIKSINKLQCHSVNVCANCTGIYIYLTTSSCCMHWSTCCSKACLSTTDGWGHSWPPSAVGQI